MVQATPVSPGGPTPEQQNQRELVVPAPEPGNQLPIPPQEKPPQRKEGVMSNPDFV